MPDIVYDAQLGVTSEGSPAPIYLRQVFTSEFDPHYEVLQGRESGNPYVALQLVGESNLAANFIQSASPEAPITTADIAGFLTSFGTLGAQIPAGETVKIPYQKRQSGGTFRSGSHNMIVQGTPAADTPNSTPCPVQLIPQTITAPRMGAAIANGLAVFLSGDGISSPFELKTSQALSGQVFNAMYGLGPVFVNSNQLVRQCGYTVSFGLQMSEKQHYDGSPYPTDIFVEMVDPVIEVQVEDFDQIASLNGLTDLTQFTAYLRMRAPGGTYIADNVANHIKFSFANGDVVPQALKASETKHGNAALRIQGVSLTVSTAATVTSP